MARRINTREKGRRKEKQVRDRLLELGYAVQLAPPPTKWAKQNDLFGLWDVIAVSQFETRYIQVKTRLSNVTKDWKQKAKAWPCPPEARKELWIMADRKEPRIIKL